MWKHKVGENHIMFFLICLEKLHSLEAPNSIFFPSTTGRRLQSPSFLGYNLREAPTPQFSGYNPLCFLDTTERWLQPHVLAPSNHPEVEV
jgi:hypothetical protein